MHQKQNPVFRPDEAEPRSAEVPIYINETAGDHEVVFILNRHGVHGPLQINRRIQTIVHCPIGVQASQIAWRGIITEENEPPSKILPFDPP